MTPTRHALKLPDRDADFKPSIMIGDRPDFVFDVAEALYRCKIYPTLK